MLYDYTYTFIWVFLINSASCQAGNPAQGALHSHCSVPATKQWSELNFPQCNSEFNVPCSLGILVGAQKTSDTFPSTVIDFLGLAPVDLYTVVMYSDQ